MCSKILYKYYGFDAGIAALKSRNLGFREPQYFNDPFELSYLSVSYPELTEDVTDFSQLRRPDLKGIGERIGILSLSQIKSDPLMWAHYGDEHTGFCIGYDIDDEFLKSKEFNLIAVDEGAVEYKEDKEILDGERYRDALSAINGLSRGESYGDIDTNLRADVSNILKKSVLYKHKSWIYEQEIRVVKILDSLTHESAEWQSHKYRSFSPLTTLFSPLNQIIDVPGLYIFNHKVRIKEVYLGMRNPLLDTENIKEKSKDDLAKLALKEGWKIESAQLPEQGSWEINFNPASEDILIENQQSGLTNKFGFSGIEAFELKDSLNKVNIKSTDSFEFTSVDDHLRLKKNHDFI